MNKDNAEENKSRFKSELKEFVQNLKQYISTPNGDWSIKGFIDVHKNIYTVSFDTKIVSKIIEIHIFPQLWKFAEAHNYEIIFAEKQNWYPDLTFVNKQDETIKFALDIKTTFRRGNKLSGFTLGSHGGYFKERDKDKNIQFPYNQYTAHYCLGIIYDRDENSSDTSTCKIENISNLDTISSVIKNFDFFVAEKWKIASDKQGSGNTANIGSITDIDN